MATTTREQTFRIAIAEDKIRAYLDLKDAAPETVFRDAIIGRVKEQGIPVTPDIVARIHQAVTAFEAGDVAEEPVPLAEGKEPIPAAPARFELIQRQEMPDGSDELSPADFHRSQIISVQKGEAFAELVPATVPVPGVDVYGKPIQPPPPPPPFELGSNIALAEDGKTAIAQVTGKVQINSNSADIVEVVEIPADVDFSTGDIDSPINVVINGTIRDTFNVKSARTIVVRKAIEAAYVEAGGDVQIHGGIAARHQGKVISGGKILTKFCNEADLWAGGDVTILREALNSRIYTRGQLTISRGSLIGGYAFARKGAEINIVGSDANIEAVLSIGIDPKDLIKVNEIDKAIAKKKQTIKTIVTTVHPLLAELKRLGSQQRDRVTSLIARAKAMETQLKHDQELKQRLLAWPEDVNEVGLTVNKLMHPGTRVIVGDKMTTFRKERPGPFRLCRRAVDGVEQIVLVDLVSGSVTLQHTYAFVPGGLPEAMLATMSEETGNADAERQATPSPNRRSG